MAVAGWKQALVYLCAPGWSVGPQGSQGCCQGGCGKEEREEVGEEKEGEGEGRGRGGGEENLSPIVVIINLHSQLPGLRHT